MSRSISSATREPGHGTVKNDQGHTYYRHGGNEAMPDGREEVDSRRPDRVPTPSALTKAAALRLKADRSVRTDEPRRAVRFYQKSLKLNPRDHIAWNNMGVALSRVGELREAIDAYTQALKVRPTYSKAWFNKGKAFQQLGMYPAAQICYANVLRINPKATAAWINMGVAHRETGQNERAFQCYERALEVDPGSSVAWNNMGVLLTRTGDLQHALQCFNKALEFDPGLHEALYEREQVIALLEQKRMVRLEAADEF